MGISRMIQSESLAPHNSTGPPRTGIQFSLGVLLAWSLFGFITLTIGNLALTPTSVHHDLPAFYAAGFLVLHNPSHLFDLHAQAAVQDALIVRMNPPLPYYHPAFEALFFAPLALFTYRTAYMLFAVLNLLLLAVCYWLAPQPIDPRIERIPRSLIFLLSFPAFYCVVTGQDSMLFLVLLCLLRRSLERDRDVTAGFLLALGLFKVQIVAALVIFLVARRGPRLLLSFIPAAGALALLSIAITGFAGAAQWAHLLASAAGATHQGAAEQVYFAVYPKAMPTLNGLLYFIGGRFLPHNAWFALNAVLLAAIFILSLLLVRRSPSLSGAFSSALAGTLLLSPHLYLYDFVLLLPALLLLTGNLGPVLVWIYCVLPFVLFAIHGIQWFAPMALLPLAILLSVYLAERTPTQLPHTQPEKVTPHPLTSLE
jgi:Glycosyltransferase family 87